MNKTYIPQPGSLPARVCEFFTEQPDEELEPLDIVAKFDAIQGGLHTQLKKAVEHGLLEIRKVKVGIRICNVYCAGPKLRQGRAVAAATPAPAPAAPAPAPAPAPAAAAAPVRRSIDDEPPEAWTAASRCVQEQLRTPTAPDTPDVPGITLEPLIQEITGAEGGRWARHLQALSATPITEQGHPTQRWPRAHGNAIQKAVNSWNKHHKDSLLHARIRGEHVIVQRIA